VQGSNLRPGD